MITWNWNEIVIKYMRLKYLKMFYKIVIAPITEQVKCNLP